MKERLGQATSRSAFWESLSRQRLSTFLLETVSALMSHLSQRSAAWPCQEKKSKIRLYCFHIRSRYRGVMNFGMIP